MLYYALQVATGKESAFVSHVNRMFPDLGLTHRLIHLTRELTIRRQGKYLKETRPLFSSYLFLESNGKLAVGVIDKLKSVPDFYHFLKSNTNITPLSPSDVSILQHFLTMGPKVGSSLVIFDENDRIVVLEGPLKGLEGNIIKVDRRKKRAKIRVDFENSPMTIDLAFEVMEKETSIQKN